MYLSSTLSNLTTTMRPIVLALILGIWAISALASTPRLLVPAPTEGGFTNPVCSPNSDAVAYTTEDFGVLYVWTGDLKPPLRVAQGAGVGRRFIFEPGQDRLVYRQVVGALPTKPERLVSTSPYLYDPAVRTANQDTVIYGPYRIDERVWYRPSLMKPYRDYHDSLRVAGPYLNPGTGQLRVINATADTVFSSGPSDGFAGMEVSPDGQWVAAVKSRPRVELTLIHLSDGVAQVIAGGYAPSWSGNSRVIVYVSTPVGGVTELHCYRVTTGENLTLLSHSRFRPETPAVNADGSRVVFIHGGALYDLTDIR